MIPKIILLAVIVKTLQQRDMQKNFNAKENYLKTKEAIGYVSRKEASQKDYDRIGFMSGLEVHQQLKTRHKLFCKCPAGLYQKPEEYDAEVIRHMRPTLSELGEYDGTALMEFKTRKTIIYHLANESACTYDIDDTPPFHIDPEALEIAIRISLLSKLNIVGEVHITRKQYLDGSIPTGFQRTGIIGVEGEIELPHKKIRLIQLSLEEDSCREVSDIGHTRVYRTDRLGMPLIETVTYPDCVNPDEVKMACDYIRFLNRSTGLVRTGIGTGRQDVNVSCKGGTRVEIKGVSHTRWIPELTHNEAFRQWALLAVRDILKSRYPNPKEWSMEWKEADPEKMPETPFFAEAAKGPEKMIVVRLPGFGGVLSHFTQPGHIFADEIIGRLKVIACLIPPFAIHSEMPDEPWDSDLMNRIGEVVPGNGNDAWMIIRSPEEDVQTALETIEERCRMAFEGVPNETRKSFPDGTTVFERVLPGADRMYPDTDTAPLPLSDDYIESLKEGLPEEVIQRVKKLVEWKVPEDTHTYILSKNLFPVLTRMVNENGLDPVFAATFLGHRLKWVEGHYNKGDGFRYEMLAAMFRYLNQNNLQPELAREMLPILYEHPRMDFDSILSSTGFRKEAPESIRELIPFLSRKFDDTARLNTPANKQNWIMGEIRKRALGNIRLAELAGLINQNL
ncbi:MAG: Glu-tRNA(Gln) amidotransferase subunit GatE [Bacteroidales bacterium]